MGIRAWHITTNPFAFIHLSIYFFDRGSSHQRVDAMWIALQRGNIWQVFHRPYIIEKVPTSCILLQRTNIVQQIYRKLAMRFNLSVSESHHTTPYQSNYTSWFPRQIGLTELGKVIASPPTLPRLPTIPQIHRWTLQQKCRNTEFGIYSKQMWFYIKQLYLSLIRKKPIL